MRRIFVSVCLFFLWFALLLYPQFALSQAISQQEWQTATIASGAITIDCADSLLPFDKGDFLDEPSLFTVRGEMDESMRSPFPVKVCLQPEFGVSDILTTIIGCSNDGATLEIRVCDPGEDITIQDSAAGNSGAIQLLDDNNILLNDERDVRIFELFGGAWTDIGSGGGSGGGGNIVFTSTQKLDMSAIDLSNANVGFIVPRSTTCAAAITLGQWCYDTDDNQICIGTGTGTMCIGGQACTDSQTCFQNSVTGIGTVKFTVLDTNNDGFVFDIGAGGPRLRCMTDYGGAGEAECTPSEIKTIGLTAGMATVDGAQCVRNIDVTLNTETVPVSITCADNDAGVITFKIPLLDRFDGTNLIISAEVHSNETTPAGDIELDWRAYCVETNEASGGGSGSYPAETANGTMTIDLDSLGGTDRAAIFSTAGNIPMSGCADSGKKSMWLRAELDATGTTADNLTDQHIVLFWLEYGSKAYTD